MGVGTPNAMTETILLSFFILSRFSLANFSKCVAFVYIIIRWINVCCSSFDAVATHTVCSRRTHKIMLSCRSLAYTHNATWNAEQRYQMCCEHNEIDKITCPAHAHAQFLFVCLHKSDSAKLMLIPGEEFFFFPALSLFCSFLIFLFFFSFRFYFLFLLFFVCAFVSVWDRFHRLFGP